MDKFKLLIFAFVLVFGCTKKESEKDLPLTITSSDTTFLDVGNLQYQNAKFHVSDQHNFLVIHQDRKLWGFDIKSGSIVKRIDFDTTQLVLPEVSILHARYSENDSSLALFFPMKRKVIHLDSELKIEKEVQLSGIDDLDLVFIPYGDHFYLDSKTGNYIIGLMSESFQDPEEFLNDTRFLGVFDGKTGMLQNSFGEFGEKRKELKSMVMSEGFFQSDFYNGSLFIREVVADPSVVQYNLSGEMLANRVIGTNKISTEIFPMDESDGVFNSISSDQFYSMKIASSDLVVSNTFSRKLIDKKYKFESHLVVEDFEKMESYSTKIRPFQRIVYADKSNILLVCNHPTKEDLILVTLEYSLGGPTNF
ncbi:hypothetical protein [Algoriphagus sp. CAU 1675]|uniref:hypothetical protein n=1 Tax=Algoriphagus sp. CAU 1675 TaxID=3032597 RepID=UPI0023DACB53|nr:hypothetical protein [Algoriphagus sp. CAU 1675]MDF2158657.1 hypothetical protein [Algoriphagus sp. CAU 1675]